MVLSFTQAGDPKGSSVCSFFKKIGQHYQSVLINQNAFCKG